MRFPFSNFGFLAMLLCCAASPCLQAQSGNARAEIETPLTLSSRNRKAEPSDIYLEVYQLSSAAERLLKSGDNEAALKAYQKALGVIDQLQTNHPSWQPDLVRYRKNENEKNVTSIKKKLDEAEQKKTKPGLQTIDDSVISPGESIPGGSLLGPGAGGAKTPLEIRLEKRLKEVLEELNSARDRVNELELSLEQEKGKKDPDATGREKQLQSSVNQLKAELEKLRANIGLARSARELELQKRVEELSVQLSAAHRKIENLESQGVGSVSGAAMARLNQELLKSNTELKAVSKELLNTREALDKVMRRAIDAEAGQTAYKSQLDKLRKERDSERKLNSDVLAKFNKQINDLEKKLKDTEEERTQTNAEMARLQGRLKETEDQLNDVTKQKDEIAEERDQLAALLKLNNPGTAKAWLDENLSLKQHLKNALEKLKELENSDTVKSADLESAQMEVALLKRRLIELRDENTNYRKSVSQLSEKLRTLDVELEKANSQPKVDPRVVAENTLLRDTIAKQLRVLESRDKARDLLIESYKRMKLQDPKMEEGIKMLDDSGTLVLSEQDKKVLDKLPASAAPPADGTTDPIKPDEQMQAYVDRQMQMEALGKSAFDAFEKGRLYAAEQLYQTLLEVNPGHYAACVNMGVILLKQGRPEEAAKILQTSVDLNPEHPVGQFLLGVALFQSRRDAAAQMALATSASLDPGNALVYYYLGNVASSAGNTALAIKEYQRALEIDPSQADIYYNMAYAYANAGKYPEARKCYDLAIRGGSLPDPVFEKRLRITRPAVPETPQKGEPAPQDNKEQPKDAATGNAPMGPAEEKPIKSTDDL